MILVSAQGPNPSFFLFFIRLGGLLGPGFGPGLDNNRVEHYLLLVHMVLHILLSADAKGCYNKLEMVEVGKQWLS